MIGFEDACLAAPVGVALLAGLEARTRPDVAWHAVPENTSRAVVGRTVRAVESMSFGELCAIALASGNMIAGPWMPDAAESVAVASRLAEHRRPVAVAIAERFGAQLHAPMDHGGQQWWCTSNSQHDRTRSPLFQRYSSVYGSGEFTDAGLWTVTDPPPESHDELVDIWELYCGPISRWRLPAQSGARVWEVHRPDDWVDLVQAHPVRAERPHSGWEIPGSQQSFGRSAVFAKRGIQASRRARPGQRATQSGSVSVPAHIVPDWADVAMSLDAVHLSWAGYITTEGYVSTMNNGSTTMLRYWASERTHWLRDCFGDPEPLAAPALSGEADNCLGIAAAKHPRREASDRAVLKMLLGR